MELAKTCKKQVMIINIGISKPSGPIFNNGPFAFAPIEESRPTNQTYHYYYTKLRSVEFPLQIIPFYQ